MKYSLTILLALTSFALGNSFPAPKSLGDPAQHGRGIQRTMRLLAESTPERSNTVRILFYGQSITEQGWWKIVAEDLRTRFPHANLIIENRALGGFASQLLAGTAETDLYPFQPDLLIFHVYGAHDKYEDIIRRTRQRTCAEILIQTDHVVKPADLTEETDPAKVPIQSGQWDAFFNQNFLPSIARKYDLALCDQRSIWKHYLIDHSLPPEALLKDSVHLNAHGEYLMGEIVKAHLRRDSALDPAPAESWVRNLVVGTDVHWKDGKLLVEFEGNRVDAVCETGDAVPAGIMIDGRKPSDFPELYGFTPAVAAPEHTSPVKWPSIAPISAEKPRLVEDWKLTVRRPGEDESLFEFSLEGSKTGPDGEGRSDRQFISNSGRVVIAPGSWNVAYSLALAGIKPVPPGFIVNWSVMPRFADEIISPAASNAAIEATVTIAQGLANTKHTLEITGSTATPITAIRIYKPPLRTE